MARTVAELNTGDPAHVSMPGAHRVASLLKRWLLGTHQGSVTGEHLDAYLNEFAFRFNRRHSRRRGLLFLRLLQHAWLPHPLGIGRRVLAVRCKTTACSGNCTKAATPL